MEGGNMGGREVGREVLSQLGEEVKDGGRKDGKVRLGGRRHGGRNYGRKGG